VTKSAAIAIRSFRLCFKLDRRIHKIDRWRIPLPFGVPLRGVGYAVGLLVAVLMVRRVPLLGDLFGAMPVPLRFVVLPIGGAYLLNQWEFDGRSAHATAFAWSRMQLSPRRIAAFRRAPRTGVVRLADVTLVSDEQSARMRPAVIEGPAEVVLRYPFSSRSRGRTLEITPEPGPPRWRGKQIRLQSDQRVVVR
jgi:hypothetical protein